MDTQAVMKLLLHTVDTSSHLLLFYGIYSAHIDTILLQLKNRDQI